MKLDRQHTLILVFAGLFLGYLVWLGRANGNLMVAAIAGVGTYLSVIAGLFKAPPEKSSKKAISLISDPSLKAPESDKAARP